MASRDRHVVHDDQGEIIGYLIVTADGDVLISDENGNDRGVARSISAARKLLQSMAFNERHYFSQRR